MKNQVISNMYEDVNFIVIFRNFPYENWEISTFLDFDSAYDFYFINPCNIKKILKVSDMVDFNKKGEKND